MLHRTGPTPELKGTLRPRGLVTRRGVQGLSSPHPPFPPPLLIRAPARSNPLAGRIHRRATLQPYMRSGVKGRGGAGPCGKDYPVVRNEAVKPVDDGRVVPTAWRVRLS